MDKKIDILYVEDNEDYIDFVKRALLKVSENLVLESATDGKTALQYFSNVSTKEYKLIFLDINMPGISGIELLQQIRSNAKLAFTPVIMFSTSDNPKDVRTSYESGANAYVIKPLGLKPLTETLRSACSFWLNYNFMHN
jgi:CheY-like chemotaxis protein